MTLRLAAVLGALAVAAGAFGAHALADHVTEARLETWRTAAHYHLLHAVMLAFVSTLERPKLPTILFTAGIVIFSGSLYLLVLLDMGILGAITPIGGVCFISGWLSLLWAGKKH